jgi:Skp family chaperone for outer membrane proteins
MKIGTVRMVVGLLLAGALTASAVAEEKIGVVNGQDTVKQFYKTQAATESLRKLDEELRDAQRRMVAKLTELDDEVKKAIAEANDKALSEEARARKRAAAEDKLADLKEYEITVRKSDMDNRKKMEEQNGLMLKPIIQEVRQAVADTAKEMGLTLVLDGSETGLGAVIYFENRLDITDAVLKRLNKNAPPPAPAKTEAEKPADPKQAVK